MASSKAALRELLQSLFTTGQARRFVQDELGEQVANEVPWEQPWADVSGKLVDELERRGLIAEPLFDALVNSRPERKQYIRGIQSRCAVRTPASGPQPPTTSRQDKLANPASGPPLVATAANGAYDVFICHASEDKKRVVEPLVTALEGAAISYWYDTNEIAWGDSITAKIDDGLARSRFVIVVVSATFLAKSWPRKELQTALNREIARSDKTVLPVLVCNAGHEQDLLQHLPLLADKRFLRWEEDPSPIIEQLAATLSPSPVLSQRKTQQSPLIKPLIASVKGRPNRVRAASETNFRVYTIAIAIGVGALIMIISSTNQLKPRKLTGEPLGGTAQRTRTDVLKAISNINPWMSRIQRDVKGKSTFVRCVAECEAHRRYGRPDQTEGYEKCRDDPCRNGIRNIPPCARGCEHQWATEQSGIALRCTKNGYVIEESREHVFALYNFSEQWGGKESVTIGIERPNSKYIEVHPNDIMVYPDTYWHWQTERGDLLGIWTQVPGGPSLPAEASCEIGEETSEPRWTDASGFEIVLHVLPL